MSPQWCNKLLRGGAAYTDTPALRILEGPGGMTVSQYVPNCIVTV